MTTCWGQDSSALLKDDAADSLRLMTSLSQYPVDYRRTLGLWTLSRSGLITLCPPGRGSQESPRGAA